MLACTRIGAVHTVVFAGFSADSLGQRAADCKCVLSAPLPLVLRWNGGDLVERRSLVMTVLGICMVCCTLAVVAILDRPCICKLSQLSPDPSSQMLQHCRNPMAVTPAESLQQRPTKLGRC